MIEPTDDNTTEWFPMSIDPVHVGSYQVKADNVPERHALTYSYWNGTHWCLRWHTTDLAHRAMDRRSHDIYHGNTVFHWRGLREQPK